MSAPGHIRSMTFADGKLWYNDGSMVHQVDPGGEKLASVQPEGDCQSGLAFNGTHLHRLKIP